ncbi:heme ABC transporter ATP-binding protein [Deinococcus irradiatisoli]|uniref:Heme ABC transporter ATP-binding protein n=1 Tax=Deinococcus irradiatisoli TaxID=2202254 RepID=A0A2Z3JN63_9DEIO|nr:ABC transporter ATP-binding protein [Deinococcus irradiatisoli]AWN24229.1 heme ABC transporter ATP-binding protein [Deinococcus irradiatisoli]
MTSPTAPSASPPPVLELRGITKRFPGVVANDNVGLQLHAGEVLALLGENGAGKSTVISVMYGLYRPDEGQILVDGQPVTIGSPAQALRLGIGLVPQHPMLVARHSVAENLALGSGSGLFPARAIAARIRELSERYGLAVDPSSRVSQLSPGEKQRVEILRSLLRGVRVLILDEPTSVLTPQEVGGLFQVMNELKADGKSLIFISHKLGEVLEITDRVTVLRKGKVTGHAPTAGATRESLAEMMVGRSVSFERKRQTPDLAQAPLRLRASGLQALSSRGLPALRGVNLEMRAGEIIGVAGVAGNGQSELVEVLAGLRDRQSGEVQLDGQPLGQDARRIFEAGVAHIPEDRIHMGTVPSMTVAENLALRDYAKAPLARGGVRDLGALGEHARRMVTAFDISTPGVGTASRLLSGGNIQKIILARELGDQAGDQGARLILAVHPTYGLDIGATEQVHRTLMQATERGACVLLVSEDLDELLALSDRIAVMYHGELLGPYDASGATREGIGLIMAGGAGQGGVPHGAGPGDPSEQAGDGEPSHTRGLRA